MKFQSSKTSWVEDLRYIFSVKTWSLTVFAFTCVIFTSGALSWWGPTYATKGIHIFENDNPEEESAIGEDDVSFVFGIVLCVSGEKVL